MDTTELLQQVVNALSLGSIYALVAIGLGVVFSIARMVNFAHGELVTIAGYTLYGLFGRVPWPVAIAAAIAVSAGAAVIMERAVFKRVKGADPVALLIVSFALSLIIQTVLLILMGGTAKPIGYPSWVQASFTIGQLTVAWRDVATCAVTFAVLVSLTRFLRRSVVGLALRASAEDQDVARILGVDPRRVIVAAFAISGALAGLAGIMWLANSASVTPTSGFEPLMNGFIAAVLGGLGSLTGAVIAGLGLGALEIVLRNVLPDSMVGLTDGLVFVAIILILLIRPQGIFGKVGREV